MNIYIKLINNINTHIITQPNPFSYKGIYDKTFVIIPKSTKLSIAYIALIIAVEYIHNLYIILLFFIYLSNNPKIINTIATGYIAFNIGIDIDKIIFSPRLQIRNDNIVIIITHFVYETFLNNLEKNDEIEFVKPMHVVRHANVNIAAKKEAPKSPNKSYITLLNIKAPLASDGYIPDVVVPIIVNIKYTIVKIIPANIPDITVYFTTPVSSFIPNEVNVNAITNPKFNAATASIV